MIAERNLMILSVIWRLTTKSLQFLNVVWRQMTVNLQFSRVERSIANFVLCL